MSEELTPLERAIVVLTATENWPDFCADCVRVVRRENTGAGRFTYLEDGPDQPLTSGTYSAQGRFVDIPGVGTGLAFEVAVLASRLAYVEIATHGHVAWDGSEDGWRIA